MTLFFSFLVSGLVTFHLLLISSMDIQSSSLFFPVMSSNGEGAMTWIIFKPTKNAGTVINVASTNWCSKNGIGANPKNQVVTKVMMKRLLNEESLFSNAKDFSM